VLRVVALAALLLLVLASVLTLQTMRRLPDSLVYLTASDGNYLRLEPVGRRSNADGTTERARVAVAHLAAGPTPGERAKGLASSVPQETRVRRISFEDGILRLDLSEEFERGGGSAGMQGRLHQLFYTLTQPRDVKGVLLMIDGRRVEVFGGEGLMVDSPWLRSDHPDLPVW
jgi:spore germination protein GerM